MRPLLGLLILMFCAAAPAVADPIAPGQIRVGRKPPWLVP
jgi:hypothetical protein